MGTRKENLHAFDPQRFLEEVHSFEFWFHSVQGYLVDTTFGHHTQATQPDLSEEERQRLISVLCNYCVAETTALEGASGLISFAPNRMSKIFLATQVVDEGRHVEVFLRRLHDLGITDPEGEIERRANPNVFEFRRRLLELVDQKDWEAALFAQNVILEAMEFVVFQAHAENADPVTREVLLGVVKDERRHIGFGENALGRMLQVRPQTRARLRKVKEELDPMVLATFEGAIRQIGEDRAGEIELGRTYLEATRRLGLA
jgi:1,2-phenylacetyl-CoA epoxidase catalytic subunit